MAITASVAAESGITGTYNRHFKVIGLSQDLMTTTIDEYTASLNKYALTPVVKGKTFNICLGDEFTGDLRNYVSNYSGEISDVTFTEENTTLANLSLTSNNGIFTYNPATVGTTSFNYKATAGSVDSNIETISFIVVADCDKCPEDDIICRYEKINSEHQSDYSGHTPYRFTERGVSTIRERDENAATEYKVTINK